MAGDYRDAASSGERDVLDLDATVVTKEDAIEGRGTGPVERRAG